MDIRKVKKLIELLEESNINELEITEGEESIRISRGAQGTTYAVQAPMAHAPMQMPAPAIAAAAPEVAAAPAEIAGHQVRSPMVGTFYSSHHPAQARLLKSAKRSRLAMFYASSKR